MSLGITEEDRERMASLAKRDTPGDTGKILGCGPIRRKYRDGIPVNSLAEDYDVLPQQVNRHIRGKCECGTNEPAIETTGSGKHERKHCPFCDYKHPQLVELTNHIQEEH